MEENIVKAKGFINKNGEKVQMIPAEHEHIISEVTGLQNALNGKAAASHTHSSSESWLSTLLAGKADASHTHIMSDLRITNQDATLYLEYENGMPVLTGTLPQSFNTGENESKLVRIVIKRSGSGNYLGVTLGVAALTIDHSQSGTVYYPITVTLMSGEVFEYNSTYGWTYVVGGSHKWEEKITNLIIGVPYGDTPDDAGNVFGSSEYDRKVLYSNPSGTTFNLADFKSGQKIRLLSSHGEVLYGEIMSTSTGPDRITTNINLTEFSNWVSYTWSLAVLE